MSELPGFFGETITSVLPSEKYGDDQDDVIAFQSANRIRLCSFHVKWHEVALGEAWMPFPNKDDRPKPAPNGGDVVPVTLDSSTLKFVLENKIPAPVWSGDAPFYVLVVSDDSTNGTGEPITWEHTFPESTTLQAVMRLQRNIGFRYGTTRIAECRIIAETELPRVS